MPRYEGAVSSFSIGLREAAHQSEFARRASKTGNIGKNCAATARQLTGNGGLGNPVNVGDLVPLTPAAG
jgi:hypothetical protein